MALVSGEGTKSLTGKWDPAASLLPPAFAVVVPDRSNPLDCIIRATARASAAAAFPHVTEPANMPTYVGNGVAPAISLKLTDAIPLPQGRKFN